MNNNNIISYYALNADSSYTFRDIAEFKNFIDECHKELTEKQFNKFVEYYNSIIALQNKDIRIYTTINGDTIYYTKYYVGIKEIIDKLKTTQKLLTTNLINIIHCNKWNYNFKENGTTIVKYTTDDANPNNNDCQIYAYTNMIVCHSPNTTIPHILNTKQYQIKYVNKME